jgi:hypothetical protein
MEILHSSINPAKGNETTTPMTWVIWYHCRFYGIINDPAERD